MNTLKIFNNTEYINNGMKMWDGESWCSLGATINQSVGEKLNFELIGGDTEPTDPIENTIWVNSNIEITNWIFSVSNPEEAMDGMIWVIVGTNSAVKMNIINSNELFVYPIAVKQYVNGNWEEKTAKIYQNEEWKELWNGILFDGNLNPKYANYEHLYPAGSTKGTVTFEDGIFKLTAPAVTGSFNYLVFTPPVETKDISNIQIDVTAKGWNCGWFGLRTNLNVNYESDNYDEGWDLFKKLSGESNTVYSETCILDLSQIDYPCYLVFGCAGSGANNYSAYMHINRIEFIV